MQNERGRDRERAAAWQWYVVLIAWDSAKCESQRQENHIDSILIKVQNGEAFDNIEKLSRGNLCAATKLQKLRREKARVMQGLRMIEMTMLLLLLLAICFRILICLFFNISVKRILFSSSYQYIYVLAQSMQATYISMCFVFCVSCLLYCVTQTQAHSHVHACKAVLIVYFCTSLHLNRLPMQTN